MVCHVLVGAEGEKIFPKFWEPIICCPCVKQPTLIIITSFFFLNCDRVYFDPTLKYMGDVFGNTKLQIKTFTKCLDLQSNK